MKKGDKEMKKEENNNVLQFPAKKMIRQRAFHKNQERKAVFGLSILSLFIFTLAVNQWVRDYSLSQASSRGVASIKAELSEEIMNEHLLAKKLALKENEISAIKASLPSLKDELMFSFLEGKYKVLTENQRIKELTPIEDLVVIKEGNNLLKKYVSLFNNNAVQYKLKEKLQKDSANEEIYELLDNKGLVVDTLSVSLDAKGNLAALKIL
jgi:hypothetical protein